MKGFGQIAVTHFLPILILKCDVLSLFCPVHTPSKLFHFFYKLFFADTTLQCFQYRHCTISHKTFFCLLPEQIIFILAPCNDFPFLDLAAIKVFSFLRNGHSPFPAHLVRELLHPFQISFGTVQLSPIFITDRIRHQMTVNVIFIFMDCH